MLSDQIRELGGKLVGAGCFEMGKELYGLADKVKKVEAENQSLRSGVVASNGIAGVFKRRAFNRLPEGQRYRALALAGCELGDGVVACIDVESDEGKAFWNAWTLLDDFLTTRLSNGFVTGQGLQAKMRDAMEDQRLGEIRKAWSALRAYLQQRYNRGMTFAQTYVEKVDEAFEPYMPEDTLF